MPLIYDKLFALLKEKGWNTSRIRNEKLIGQATLTSLRNNTGGLDHRTIAKICHALNCQPGDIMEYVSEDPPKKSKDEEEHDNPAKDKQVEQFVPTQGKSMATMSNEEFWEQIKALKKTVQVNKSKERVHRLYPLFV